MGNYMYTYTYAYMYILCTLPVIYESILLFYPVLRFLVRVSYLEIYNEEVRDLLNKKSKEALKIRERPDVGVYVKDLLSFVVKDTEEMEKLMSIGNKNSKEERDN